MNNRRENSGGMTIVEVLVSVIIISLVMGLLFTLLIQVQKASTDVKKKSSLLISQNVVTKAIEKDMIEVGVKAISKCTYDQFNLNDNLINTDEGEDYRCVRIEFNESYDLSDVGYILIYKQRDEKWVMRYGKGYYRECAKGRTPENYATWNETYSVVQKLEDGVKLTVGKTSDKFKVSYSANFEPNKKYSEQKKNTGNLFIPISDDNNYTYNLDLSFTFRINIPTEETPTNPRLLFTCDEDGATCECIGSSYNCGLTRTTGYTYTCSESKERSASVAGTDKSFTEIESVISARLNKTNIATVTFKNPGEDKVTPPENTSGPIDISYSQNGSTSLYYKKNDTNNDLYDVYIYQAGGVSVFGTSLASMFKGFTNLYKVDFEGFKSSGVTNMSSMFSGDTNLKELVNFDKLDLSSVRDVSSMFMGCKSLRYSPFRNRTDLGNINNATSLFSDAYIGNYKEDYYSAEDPKKKESTKTYTFNYEVDFPAYNVTTLKYFLKNTGVNEFIMTDKTLPNLKNMSGMLTNTSRLKILNMSNLNVPVLEAMYGFLEKSSVSETHFVNIASPNLTTMKDFYAATTSLNNIGFDNFDTSHVEDFSHFFYKATGFSGTLDLRKMSFASADNVSATFELMTNLNKVYFSDDPSFNLDTVTRTDYMFSQDSRFYGFEGVAPSFRNALDVNHMFNGVYTVANGTNYPYVDFDATFLHLEKCENFSYMFLQSGFTTINMSGMHSKVEPRDGLTITLKGLFEKCKKLKYAFLNDFDIKAVADTESVFYGDDVLTFSTFDISNDEKTNRYLSGEGGYVYLKSDGSITENKSEGANPFHNFIIQSGTKILTNMFKGCKLLRGFPEGYLDGILDHNDATYISMFEEAFSAPISSGVTFESEDAYKNIYKIVLPFHLRLIEDSGNMFKNATNLASIEFANSGERHFGGGDSTASFHYLGKKALEDGRISAFDLKINDMLYIYDGDGSYSHAHRLSIAHRYIYSGFNFTSYANKTGNMNIYLSSNCDIAKEQYTGFEAGISGSFKMTNQVVKLNYIFPSGCSA